MRFYSSNGEDKWVAKNITLPKKGFYVDIGAAHPTRMSNTAFLRDMGWEGIQVDADPYWIPYWNKIGLNLINRVISKVGEEIYFKQNNKAHRLSKVVTNSRGNAISLSLNNLLENFSDEIPHIDFMSLDVEGIEYDIFKNLDKKYWPDTLVFEYNTLGKLDYRLQRYLLNTSYYKELWRTKSNFIFGSKRDEKVKRIGIDIDGTLTVETKGLHFANRTPELDIIKKVNQYYDEGHIIILFSSRMESDREITKKWLKKYGVKYHVLMLDKPVFDIYVGDEVKTINQFLKEK